MLASQTDRSLSPQTIRGTKVTRGTKAIQGMPVTS